MRLSSGSLLSGNSLCRRPLLSASEDHRPQFRRPRHRHQRRTNYCARPQRKTSGKLMLKPGICCYQESLSVCSRRRDRRYFRDHDDNEDRPQPNDGPADLVCSNITLLAQRRRHRCRHQERNGVVADTDIATTTANYNRAKGNATLFSATAFAASILSSGLPALIHKKTLSHAAQTTEHVNNNHNHMMHCTVDKSTQNLNTNEAMEVGTASKNTPENTRLSYMQDPATMVRHLFLQELLVTTAVIIVFIATRTIYTVLRRRWARITVIVIGGGPIGLTATYIASKCGRVARLVLYEELCRSALVNRLNQLAFDFQSITFLKGLGIDFDNLEGCWQNNSFATRAGIFQEYLLNLLGKVDIPMDLKFQTKFTRNHVKETEDNPGRIVVIVCDGSQGSSGRLLGISDECVQHSCNTYGAIATLDRNNERQEVPMSEKRIHHLTFDLTSYGADSLDENYTPGFSMKLFGSSRHRYMTLVTPKIESKCVKALRVILDRSMMRNIFMKCFNTFRSDNEAKLAESEALKNMKFSPRLFEIKLFQRYESVAYYSDPDIFILAEGDAARCYNFSTGMDVNIGIKGLVSLPTFLDMVSWAETENHITSALGYKARYADKVCRDIVKHGLREYMFT